MTQKKRKGKTSLSTLKGVKLAKPEIVKAPLEPTPMAVEATPKHVVILPRPALPQTMPIPWLFPSNTQTQGVKEAMPSLAPQLVVGETFPQDWKDNWEAMRVPLS